jgi:hypothetical protein
MLRKYITSLGKKLGNFQNRKFSKQVAAEKSKKYLVTRNNKRIPFLEIYNRARRGAYLRPFYSVFQNTGYDYRIIFGTLGIFMIVGCLYIVVFSTYFQVLPSRVIIERNDTHSDINIAYRSIEEIYGESFWIIDEQEVAEQIRVLQKNIETVKLDRVMPNIIRIIIESSPLRYAANFQWASKTYNLSENGVLIPSRSQDSELKRLTIHSVELSESPYLDYKEAIPPSSIKYLMQAESVFGKEFPKSAVTSINFYVVENEFHLLLENGTRILLVCDSSLEKQLLWVKIGLENMPGLLTTDEFYYIDARVLGKLFVCKDPVQCQRNLNKLYSNSH